MPTLTITAIPRAKKREVQKISKTEYRVYTPVAPEDNKATLYIIAQLNDFLSIPKSHISCLRGHTSRKKIFQIE